MEDFLPAGGIENEGSGERRGQRMYDRLDIQACLDLYFHICA
jgi:hypothetical protein